MTARDTPAPAIAALRRSWPLLVFVLLAFAFTPKALTGQRVLAPVDMLEAEAPWRADLPHDPYVHSPEQTDQIEGLPNTVEFFRELRSGRFQQWDPQIGAGGPTGTQPLWGLLSPFHAGYLFAPEWYAPALRVFAALVAGMGFTFLFLRNLGVSRTAAVLAGAAYAFNGANLVLLNRIMAVFLLPGLLWACWRVLHRPSVGSVAGVAVFTAWAWLEGFPSGFFYNLATAALLVTWVLVWRLVESRAGPEGAPARRWPSPEAWRAALARGVAAAVGVGWGVAVAAINLLPFLSEIVRIGSLDSRVYDRRFHLSSLTMFGLVDPTAGVGPPAVGVTWAGIHPVEGTVVVGLLAVVGALAAVAAAAAGRLRIPEQAASVWAFFAVGTPLVTLLVYFPTPLLDLVYKVPGLAQGPFTRARYLIPFGIVVLAAIGFDGLVRRSTAVHRPWRGWAIGSLALTGAMALWAAPSWFDTASAADQLPIVARSLAVGAALTAVVVALVVVARRRPSLRPLVVVAGCVVVFVQLAVPLRGYTPEAPIGRFFPETEGHATMAELTDGRYRFAATMFNFYPNSSTVYDLHDLRGLVLRDDAFRGHILAANPGAFDRDPLKLLIDRDEWTLDAPVYDEYAVRYLALDLTETPYGDIEPVVAEWDRWESTAGRPDEILPAPDGEVTALAVGLRAGEGCEAARTTVTVTDDNGASVSATRRAAVAGGGTWQWFGLPVDAGLSGGELAVSIEVDDPVCDFEVGVNDAAGGALAAQWMVDDPDDGVRLVANEGALVYERPNAFELVTVHDRWEVVDDPTTAVERLAERTPGVEYPALVVGPVPAEAASGQGGAAEVHGWRFGDDRVEVDVTAEDTALLAVRQNHSPDWKVHIDGEPVELVALNGSQQAVFVPAGDHRVVFTYEPAAFRVGVTVSAVALLALVVAGAWVGWRRLARRASHHDEPELVEPTDGW
ncbi:MAG: YfhO family protein [Acidimicrobiia bacterium]|nr:YfhO family protein [Acidimicrobiia bacterium]